MRDVEMPCSLDDLWLALEKHVKASVCAGGTDLHVRMRSGLVNPDALVCIERISELKGVSEHGGHIRIGACTTHSALLSNPVAKEHLSVLTQALRVLGSPLIRNMGTIGGNICTASPAGDTLPPLYVLKTSVELASRNGSRTVPIEDFIEAPGVTGLEKGEILAAVWVPKPIPGSFHHFEKVGLRNALACSVVSLAAVVRASSDGTVEEASFAWGSLGPTIVRCPDAERLLRGEKLNVEKLQETAVLVQKAVSPIDDVRATAQYRRTVAGNLLLRLAVQWASSLNRKTDT